jgi:predicted patatin/cPLA2 family phospholipase
MNSIESAEVLNAYLSEMHHLVEMLKNTPTNYMRILRQLSMTKDNSRLLGFLPIYKLWRKIHHCRWFSLFTKTPRCSLQQFV